MPDQPSSPAHLPEITRGEIPHGLAQRGVRGTLNQKSAIKLLQVHGWTRSTGGKHQVKMVKKGRRPITLPDNHRRDYPPGLAIAILKQAGLR
ncbi:MAG: type II toxin-antitoxin system HicA family toxin [Solirubrobacterales bacterium]